MATAPSVASNLDLPAIVVRPGASRFHSRFGWLDSWHTFSFADHYDPDWMGFGPLRVINDDTVAAHHGFGMHPHRDMEIVTVMVEGELQHRDSLGHTELLKAGEVQRMSAGTGVVHSEMNVSDQPCRFLQIWIEPIQRGLSPAYEQTFFPPSHDWTLLLDPAASSGAMAIARPVRLWRAQPQAGDRLVLPAIPGRQVWLQLVDGSLDLPAPLQRGDGLGFTMPDQQLDWIAGSAGADMLLFELPTA